MDKFWSPWESFAKKYQFEISQEFKTLFTSMVACLPEHRWTLQKVIESPWINDEIPLIEQVQDYMEILNQHILMEKQYYEQMMNQQQFQKEEEKNSEERINVEEKLNLEEQDLSMDLDDEEFDLNN